VISMSLPSIAASTDPGGKLAFVGLVFGLTRTSFSGCFSLEGAGHMAISTSGSCKALLYPKRFVLAFIYYKGELEPLNFVRPGPPDASLRTPAK
jgi:hypothetical protein